MVVPLNAENRRRGQQDQGQGRAGQSRTGPVPGSLVRLLVVEELVPEARLG